MKKRRTYRRK